jgi:hypothetical protein
MHPENQFPFTRGRSPEQIQVELLQQQIQLEAQLQDIQARTIVERVAAARALEAARNVEGETKEERAVRANTAAILEQARAERELADAKRDRDRSSREAVENLQLELNLVGKTAAEQAALRFEYERLLQIQHEMEDQGTSIDRYRQEIELLQQRTEAIKQYTQALNRAKLQFDIMTEREEIFMKESEREIRGRIRGAGLDPNMEPALQAQLRYNQELERTRDTWQMIFDEVNSGVDSMVDALFEGGQSFEDTLKQIGRQFARLMFDLAVTNPIKNWLTGSEFKTIADLGIFGKGASSGRGGGFGGALGKLFGADKIATATMQVQAATVIVNGGIPGLPGGIPGLPGADGGGGGGGGGPTDIAQKYIQSRIDSAFGTKPSSASTSGQNYIQTRIDQAFSSITGGGGGGGGGGGNWLNYINQSATRNLPLSPKLVEQMSFLQDMGIRMDVFSGGQPAFGAGRVGSHRHDLGGAADVFFSKGGRRLDWANAEDVPIFQEIVSRAKARGVTGFGAGEGYMQPGSMHIGGGPEAVWGRGGSGANAPSWLRDAASGQGGMSQASQAIDTMTTSATNAASSLAKVGLSGFETVKGLTDAAGGLTQFGNILKNFMAPGGGSEAGWFQSLIKGAGSLFGGGPAGAVSYMQSISPAATSAILSGAGGLYQQGGFTGGSDRRGIAGLVHQKEFVFDADSTQRIGVHNLEKIRRSKLPGAVPTPPTWSANAMWRSNGGGGGGGLGGSNATKIINVFDPTVVGDYLSTDAGEKMVMNVMRRNPSGRGGASG